MALATATATETVVMSLHCHLLVHLNTEPNWNEFFFSSVCPWCEQPLTAIAIVVLVAVS